MNGQVIQCLSNVSDPHCRILVQSSREIIHQARDRFINQPISVITERHILVFAIADRQRLAFGMDGWLGLAFAMDGHQRLLVLPSYSSVHGRRGGLMVSALLTQDRVVPFSSP